MRLKIMNFLVLFLCLTGTVFSQSSNTQQDTAKQTPLFVNITEGGSEIQFTLNREVANQQALLIITDAMGQEIISEEVEILKGIVFKTLTIKSLQNYPSQQFMVTVKSENKLFKTEFSL
ncbi:hypothetical protein [Crocinitomix algicola]|uniref:hypothetical protein n=1 Tax=Crocinitomix algicola TaxID=1740263 RepID=UPI001112F6CB|nr:hypothetical protein [Crocinitomix algicola]